MIDSDAVIAIVEGPRSDLFEREREREPAELRERFDRVGDDVDVPLLGESDVSKEPASVFDLGELRGGSVVVNDDHGDTVCRFDFRRRDFLILRGFDIGRRDCGG